MKDPMIVAIEEAKKGIRNKDGAPCGAVITKNGKIISKGHSIVFKKNNPTAHAEMEAIRKASKKLKTHILSDCEIYSTTEPCPMCYSAIHWARIKKIYFGTSILDLKNLGFNELLISNATLKDLGHNKTKIVPSYKVKECRELLKYWKTKKLNPY